MTLAQIEALAAGGESETLELKASTGERNAGAMAVCAMLNHRGGNTNRAMSRDEYHRVLLERLHGQHRWENEPVP